MLMIEIDGSYGEGGGQILRTAVALSCLTGESIKISRIRANRPKPGLAMQHLKGIEAAKFVSNAEVEGLSFGSTEVKFKPGELKKGKFRIDIGTAGSVTLILQTILLPSFLHGNSFEIRGGTDVNWSPPFDYFKNVFLRALREMKGRVNSELMSRGYYPKGGGLIKVDVEASDFRGFQFIDECRKDAHVSGVSHCLNLPRHVVERQSNSARKILISKGYNPDIKNEAGEGFSTGSGITLWCGYKGGSSLGERGKRAEIVGKEAADNILAELESNACFDEYLADQLMPFAAIAEGKTAYTTSKITLHQKSNAYVIESFFGDIININEQKKEIKIKGVGII